MCVWWWSHEGSLTYGGLFDGGVGVHSNKGSVTSSSQSARRFHVEILDIAVCIWNPL
jgi:hypothetical protein